MIGNPDLLPSKLQMGSESHPPVSEMDDALYNKDRMDYHRWKILNRKRGPQGVRGSIAALMKLAQELPEKFFHVQMGDPSKELKPTIHMQSKFM